MDRTEDEVLQGPSFGEIEAITLIIFFGVWGFFLLNCLYIGTRLVASLIPGGVWISASIVAGIISIFRFSRFRWVNLITTITIHGIGFGLTLAIFTLAV